MLSGAWEKRQTLKRRAWFPEGWRGTGQQDCCLGLCEERTEEGNCPPHGLPLVGPAGSHRMREQEDAVCGAWAAFPAQGKGQGWECTGGPQGRLKDSQMSVFILPQNQLEFK